MVTDEWERWQQGGCLAYAVALQRLSPALRFGTLNDDDSPVHHFAYDDEYAYDSAGRHSLPYRGISGALEYCPNESADWYEEVDENEVRDAQAHAIRNHILEGR